MENELIRKQIERLKKEKVEEEERQKLVGELQKLQQDKWKRQHPRLANLYNFFSGFSFGNRRW